MKFRLQEDYSPEFRHKVKSNYSDEELWSAFLDVVWPKYSEEEKVWFLSEYDPDNVYESILQIPVEDGMEDRSWIEDELELVGYFDDDYSMQSTPTFSYDDYLHDVNMDSEFDY